MENNWHLSKGISVMMIVAAFGQIVGLVGIYYKVDNRIAHLEKWQMETVKDRFTVTDGNVVSDRVTELKELINNDLQEIKEDIRKIADKQSYQSNDITAIKTILQYSDIEDSFSLN